jgi:hypothetical protein
MILGLIGVGIIIVFVIIFLLINTIDYDIDNLFDENEEEHIL